MKSRQAVALPSGRDPMDDERPDEQLVTVTAVQYFGGTLAYADGITSTGDAIRFVGEPRYLARFAEVLEAGGEPIAIVPRWSLLA